MPEKRQPIIPPEAYLPSNDIKLTKQVATALIQIYLALKEQPRPLDPETQKLADSFEEVKKVLNLAELNDGQYMIPRVFALLTLMGSGVLTAAHFWYLQFLREHSNSLKTQDDYLLRLFASLAGTGLGAFATFESIKHTRDTHQLRYGISKQTLIPPTREIMLRQLNTVKTPTEFDFQMINETLAKIDVDTLVAELIKNRVFET